MAAAPPQRAIPEEVPELSPGQPGRFRLLIAGKGSNLHFLAPTGDPHV